LFSALKRFRAEHPRIVCDLELSDGYLDLSSGDIDLALRATSNPPDYLVARRLHSHRFVLVAAPDYLDKHGRPRTLNDMEDHAALCYRGAQGVAPWLCLRDGGEAVPVPRRPVLVTNNGLLLLQAALEGEGMALLPDWGVVQGLSEGKLEEVSLEDGRVAVGTGPEMSLYLLYDPQKARLGKVRALVDFLVEELSQSD
jgi:DNA-binding transcriptional LysR family regulator